MKNALVFAYGSNMNARQMAIRCPGSKAVSVAKLRDHQLVFTGRSERWGGGGVATIQPARRSNVLGVLWILSADNLERLDGFEGYPYVYDRIAVRVESDSGRPLWCYTYVKNEVDEKTAPSPEYLRTILDGYATAGAAVPVNLKRLYGQVRQLGLAA